MSEYITQFSHLITFTIGNGFKGQISLYFISFNREWPRNYLTAQSISLIIIIMMYYDSALNVHDICYED